MGYGAPAITAIFAHVEIAGRATQGESIVTDAESMPVDDVLRFMLRPIPAGATPSSDPIPCVGDKQCSIDRHALRIRLARRWKANRWEVNTT